MVLAGLRSDQGASRQRLLFALDRQVICMLASVPLMLEYESVLTRPERLKESGLSVRRPRLKDPADEMVLETAVNGKANYLVTFNARHFGQATAAFGIRVVSPGEVVRKLKGAQHEGK